MKAVLSDAAVLGPRLDLRAQARRDPLPRPPRRRRRAPDVAHRPAHERRVTLARGGARARAGRRLRRRRRAGCLRQRGVTSFAAAPAAPPRERVRVFYLPLRHRCASTARTSGRCRCASARRGCAGRSASTARSASTRTATSTARSCSARPAGRGSRASSPSAPTARTRATRSRDWLKLKCHAEQELVIGGYTAPQGSRTDFGALLVGYNEDGALRYAGKVGTGFDHALLRELGERLRELERDDPPFADVHPIPRGHALGRARSWSAQIGVLASGRATAGCATRASWACATTSRPATSSASGRRESVEITHPDKLLFPDDGITKADLAGYYEASPSGCSPTSASARSACSASPTGSRARASSTRTSPDYFPGWLRRVEVPKRGGTVTHVVRLRRGDARLPRRPEHDHAARVAVARRPAWPARPDGDRPRPAARQRLRRRARAPPATPASCCASSGFKPFAQVTGSKGIHVVDAAAPARRRTRRCAPFARDIGARPRRPPPRRADAASGARRSAAAASWSTWCATPTPRPPCRPTRCGRARARRSPRRSTGTSCPTRSSARTAGP